MVDWQSDHVLRTCKADGDTLSASDWATKWVVLAKQRRFPCIFEGEPMTWAWWLNDLVPYLPGVTAQDVLTDAERRNEPECGSNSTTPHYNVMAESLWRRIDQRPPPVEERKLAEAWAAIHVEAGYWTREKQEDYLSHYPGEEELSLGLEDEVLALW